MPAPERIEIHRRAGEDREERNAIDAATIIVKEMRKLQMNEIEAHEAMLVALGLAVPPRRWSGIGDITAAIFELVGIAAFVKYLASKRNKKCGCPVRQQVMNQRFFGLWLWFWDWRYIWWCPCEQH